MTTNFGVQAKNLKVPNCRVIGGLLAAGSSLGIVMLGPAMASAGGLHHLGMFPQKTNSPESYPRL